MKNRNILIIALIIILLLVIYIKQRTSQLSPSKIGGGYAKIFPENFTPEVVKKIRFYPGKSEDNAVELDREKSGDGSWRVITLFNAKGNNQTINNFLVDFKNIEGEERASSKEVFSDFTIGDTEAYHLVLYGSENKELYHLLIGKQGPTFNDGFLRFKDKDNIFLVNKNIRSVFNVFGNDLDKPTDSKKWAERKLLDLNKDSITRLTLNEPKIRIVIEKMIKETGGETPVQIPVSIQDEGQQPGSKEDEKEKKVEYEWIITEPKIKNPIKHDQIDPLLSSLTNTMGDDLVDPAKIAEYGLTESKTSITIETEDKKEHKLILGNKADEKSYYIAQDGNNVFYKIDEQKYKNIFGKMEEIAKASK